MDEKTESRIKGRPFTNVVVDITTFRNREGDGEETVTEYAPAVLKFMDILVADMVSQEIERMAKK